MPEAGGATRPTGTLTNVVIRGTKWGTPKEEPRVKALMRRLLPWL